VGTVGATGRRGIIMGMGGRRGGGMEMGGWGWMSRFCGGRKGLWDVLN
jgi:hypothetical protein